MFGKNHYRKLLITSILLCVIVPVAINGANFAGNAETLEKRVFSVKFKRIDDVIQLVNSQLSREGSILLKPGLDTFTVEDHAENLVEIEKILKAFDIPPKNIEVIIKLIKASKTEEKGSDDPAQIKDEIKTVSSKLRSILKFTDYELLGSGIIPATEGEEASVLIADNFQISFKVGFLHEGSGIIRLEGFTISQKKDGGEEKGRFQQIIKTTFNLRNNQPFILSASRMEKSRNALIITISASTGR